MTIQKPVVIAKCVGCKKKRIIVAGEIRKGDHPMCRECFMPMVAVGAEG